MGSFNGKLTRILDIWISGYLGIWPTLSPRQCGRHTRQGEPKSGEAPNISDSRPRNSPAPEIT